MKEYNTIEQEVTSELTEKKSMRKLEEDKIVIRALEISQE